MLKPTRSVMRGEGGAALVVTLLVAVVGVVALGATATLAHGTLRSASQWRDAGAVRYVAESGINEALYRLKFDALALPNRVYPSDPPSFSSDGGLVGEGARYDVWVWADAANPLVKYIAAVGARGSTRQLVRSRAEPLNSSPFSQSYASGGQVGEGQSVPVVNVPPDLPPPAPKLTLSGTRTYYLGYPSNNDPNYIRPHKVLETPQGPVAAYSFTQLEIGGGAKVVILGTVHLWVTGDPASSPDVKFAGTSDVNVVREGNTWVGGDPTKLLIWVLGQAEIEFELTGTTEFYGGIFAPHSTLSIAGTADMYGGVVVKELNIGGGATLEQVYSYYDTMAGVAWPYGTQLDYRVVGYE